VKLPVIQAQRVNPGQVSTLHVFESRERMMLLSIEDGSIYQLPKSIANVVLSSENVSDYRRAEWILQRLGIEIPDTFSLKPTEAVETCAYSLAIAQKCNLGCTYCYAQQGDFGGPAQNMSLEVAQQAIDRLLADKGAGDSVSLAFMGGEPLVNREVLRQATIYASEKANAKQIKMRFAITTNATMLTSADVDFFDQYRFSVTVSIDGLESSQNQLRPFKSGRDSYSTVVTNAKLLLNKSDRNHRVTARVTVTPVNLRLPDIIQHLIEIGFDQVQVSPLLNSANGQYEMETTELQILLSQMIECGHNFEQAFRDGEGYPLSNIVSTLRRIHRYKRDSYPCGAGGGYQAVSAEGKLYACHRFVNDQAGFLGEVAGGVNPQLQASWLESRSVHNQMPCNTCWARYLCNGGCHHEAMNRGRPACEYIMGWLEYCLGAYARLMESNPDQLVGLLDVGSDQL